MHALLLKAFILHINQVAESGLWITLSRSGGVNCITVQSDINAGSVPPVHVLNEKLLQISFELDEMSRLN